jgi:internalin A
MVQGLSVLDITDRNISNLNGIQCLVGLKTLNLTNYSSDCDSTPMDLTPLADLTGLTSLNLSGNNVSDLAPLEGLTDLTFLEIDGGCLGDITPLGNLTGLTTLFLVYNNISDITPLASLTGLTILNLDGSNISDITPLASLSNLAYLSLENTGVSDLSPLVENEGLAEGDFISLLYILLDCGDPATLDNIQTLMDRGVEFCDDCINRCI